jgi:hypothetical protein
MAYWAIGITVEEKSVQSVHVTSLRNKHGSSKCNPFNSFVSDCANDLNKFIPTCDLFEMIPDSLLSVLRIIGNDRQRSLEM